MGKIKDLTGQEFDNWIVHGLDYLDSKSHMTYWKCKCRFCSNIVSIKRLIFLNTNDRRLPVCPCQVIPEENIIGKRFDNLTVIEEESDSHSNKYCICQCDCKNIIRMKKETLYNSRRIKNCGCSLRLRGNTNPRFKSKKLDSAGYNVVYAPLHPNSNKYGNLREHVLVMSDYMKRPLRKGETVHHRNGIKSDNRIENLELWSSNHSGGQRVVDLLKFAHEIIDKYKYYQNPTKKEDISPDWFELEK